MVAAWLYHIFRGLAVTVFNSLFGLPCLAGRSSPAAIDPGAASAGELRKVGVLRTRSRFLRSAADGGLCFWHQRKEEDYALKPDWEKAHGAEHRKKCGAETFAKLVAAGKVARAGGIEGAARARTATPAPCAAAAALLQRSTDL